MNQHANRAIPASTSKSDYSGINPNWSQQKIAEEVGCTQGYVARVITKMSESDKTVIPSTLQSRTDQADFRKLPPELQQKVAAKEVSLNAAAIQAGIRKKPTPAEIVVKTFAKVENRLETLRTIVQALSDAERQVVKDWLTDSR
jgi:DNA-binding MarR family transcriptional regulator